MSGFAVMSRAMLEHPELQGAERLVGWFKLVASAAFEPVTVAVNGAQITLSGGQVYGTIKQFGSAFGWNDLSVNRFFRRLEMAGMISRCMVGRGVVVTILDRSTFAVDRFEGNGSGLIACATSPNRKRRPVFGRGRDTIPAAVRSAVRDRDGDKCRYCGCVDGPFEFDHVVPHSRGGLDTIANLVVACRACNSLKGAHTPQEMGWTL